MQGKYLWLCDSDCIPSSLISPWKHTFTTVWMATTSLAWWKKASLLLLACSTVYWYPHVEGLLNTCASIVCFGLLVVLAPAGCTVAHFLTGEFQCTFRIVVLFNCLLPPKQHVAMVTCRLYIMNQHCKFFFYGISYFFPFVSFCYGEKGGNCNQAR